MVMKGGSSTVSTPTPSATVNTGSSRASIPGVPKPSNPFSFPITTGSGIVIPPSPPRSSGGGGGGGGGGSGGSSQSGSSGGGVVQTPSGGVSTAFPEKYTEAAKPSVQQTPPITKSSFDTKLPSSFGGTDKVVTPLSIQPYWGQDVKGSYGQAGSRQATSSEINFMGGAYGGSAFSFAGELYPTRSGRGTTMGKTPDFSIFDITKRKSMEIETGTSIKAGQISYDISQKRNKEYESDKVLYVSAQQQFAETKKEELINNEYLTAEEKQSQYGSFISDINKNIQDYSKQRSEYYTDIISKETTQAISVDPFFKQSARSMSDLGFFAESRGIKIGKDVFGQTSFVQKDIPLSTVSTINALSRQAVDFILPAAELLSTERTDEIIDPKTFSGYTLPQNKDIIPIGATVLTGIFGASSQVSSAAKAVASEKAGQLLSFPTEEFAIKSIADKSFSVPEYTLFNPSKQFSFGLEEKAINRLGSKIAKQKEIAINPYFGKEFEIAGAGFIKQDFTSLPSSTKSTIEGLGLKPIDSGLFSAKAVQNLKPISESSWSKYLKEIKPQERNIIGGTFEIGGVKKQLAFITGPRGGGLRISDLSSIKFDSGGFAEGTRLTFKEIKNTGKPLMEWDIRNNIAKVGLYREGQIFKNIGEFKSFVKQSGLKEKELGGVLFSQKNIEGLSFKFGKQKDLFSGPEIIGFPKYSLPRITKLERPLTFTQFKGTEVSVLGKKEFSIDIMKSEFGDVYFPRTTRRGTEIFKIKSFEKNMPIPYSKIGKGAKGGGIPLEEFKLNIDKYLSTPAKKVDELATFYHGTTSKYELDILKKGLKPAKQTGIYQGIVKPSDFVSVGTSEDIAKGFAQRAVIKKGGEPIVFEIKIPKSKLEKYIVNSEKLSGVGELRLKRVPKDYLKPIRFGKKETAVLEELRPSYVGGMGGAEAESSFQFGKTFGPKAFTAEELNFGTPTVGPKGKIKLMDDYRNMGPKGIYMPTFLFKNEYTSRNRQFNIPSKFGIQTQEFKLDNSFKFKSKLSQSQYQPEAFKQSFKQYTPQVPSFRTTPFTDIIPTGGFTPQPFPSRITGFDFGGFGFAPSLDLGLGGSRTAKGKRKKGKVGPSLTAQVFNIRGAFPKSGKFGISPFQIRAIPKKGKNFFDIGL